ncbi:MAG: insulinase family protein [Rectinemataceae bacterium]
MKGTQRGSLAAFLLCTALLLILPAPWTSAEPAASSTVLPNGLSVFLQPIRNDGTVSVMLAFRAGANNHTPRTAGLFNLLAQLLFSGSPSSPGSPDPGDAIAALDPSDIRGEAGLDIFSFGLTARADRLPQILDTLWFLFSESRFEFLMSQPAGIEHARELARNEVIRALSSSDVIQQQAAFRRIFATAPYRVDAVGADYVLEQAQPQQLRELYRTWFVPNNALLSIAGDIDQEQTLALIRERFSAWQRKANPWAQPPAVFPRPGITRPQFLVLPDQSIRRNEMQIELLYRGPDPSSTASHTAAAFLQALINRPDSKFRQNIARGMPRGAAPLSLAFAHAPSAMASTIAINATIPFSPGQQPADLALQFKELVRGTELYMVKANASYFAPSEYEAARQSLLEGLQAQRGDTTEASSHAVQLWGWGILDHYFRETDAVMRITQKDIAQFVDSYIQKNLEVITVRINPQDHAAAEKQFSSYGFVRISGENAFWWR